MFANRNNRNWDTLWLFSFQAFQGINSESAQDHKYVIVIPEQPNESEERIHSSSFKVLCSP